MTVHPGVWLWRSAFFVFSVIFLLQVMKLRGDERLKAQYQKQVKELGEWSGGRGRIFDRQNHLLAVNQDTYEIRAPWRKMTPEVRSAVVIGMQEILGRKIQPEESQALFFLPPEKAEVLKRKRVNGVPIGLQLRMEKRNNRYYPLQSLAGNLIGYRSAYEGGKGGGLEWAFEDYLKESTLEQMYRRVAFGRPIPGAAPFLPALDGYDLVLTIDEALQYIVEEEISQAMEKEQAVGAVGMVMNAQTGELLALASAPVFNPNEYASQNPENLRHKALYFVYEPGSTFKPIALSIALEDGKVKESFEVVCTGQRPMPQRSPIGEFDGRAHGKVTLREILVKSCNVGASEVGSLISDLEWKEWLQKFGFGQAVMAEEVLRPRSLEARGLLPAQFGPTEKATLGFGQGIAVTPIQLLRAYSAFANGGEVVDPCVVKEIRKGDGEPIFRCQRTAHRVLSKETVDFILNALKGVVLEGTGTALKMEGYPVAGKTGTAQKTKPGGGYYHRDEQHVVVSFFAFYPADSPRFLVAVVLDDPKTYRASGGQLAAPAVKNILKDIFWYYGIPPQTEAGIENGTRETD